MTTKTKERKSPISPPPCDVCPGPCNGKTCIPFNDWARDAWNKVCEPFRKLAAQSKT